MAHSPALSQFLDSLDAPSDPRRLAYDVETVRSLDAAERTIAEDALIERAEDEDPRAIKSLALLDVQRATTTLETVANNGTPLAQHAAKRAIAQLTADPDAIREVVDSLGGHIDAFTAWDLKSMDGEEALRGLFIALRSPDLPARLHALDGLADRYDVTDLRKPRQTPLGRFELLLGGRIKSLYLPVGAALVDIFSQLGDGLSPANLGLTYQPSDDDTLVERFWASCGSTGKPYATELLDDMSEHDRAWAHALIVCRVENEDRRSLDAIASLDLRWALPVLEDFETNGKCTDDAFLSALAATRDALDT